MTVETPDVYPIGRFLAIQPPPPPTIHSTLYNTVNSQQPKKSDQPEKPLLTLGEGGRARPDTDPRTRINTFTFQIILKNICRPAVRY